MSSNDAPAWVGELGQYAVPKTYVMDPKTEYLVQGTKNLIPGMVVLFGTEDNRHSSHKGRRFDYYRQYNMFGFVREVHPLPHGADVHIRYPDGHEMVVYIYERDAFYVKRNPDLTKFMKWQDPIPDLGLDNPEEIPFEEVPNDIADEIKLHIQTEISRFVKAYRGTIPCGCPGYQFVPVVPEDPWKRTKH